MQTVLHILSRAGGWRPSFSLVIANAPYPALVIEAADGPGPLELPAVSVAHYGNRNGELLCDPEICFELLSDAGVELDPYYWRNDFAEVEQWSRFRNGSEYQVRRELHQQHLVFARMWDRNLRAQGFYEAFLRQQEQTQRP